MKLKLYLVFFFTINLYAQDLSEILELFQNSKKILSIKEKTNSQIAQQELKQTQEAPELGINVAQRDEENNSGVEYSIDISQNIQEPFSASNKNNAVKYYTKALNQKNNYQISSLRLELASKYHFACISKQIKDKSKNLYDEQSARYKQLKLSYDLGDISKKALLFNKLDLAKLKQKVSYYKRDYLSQFSSLQEYIDNQNIENLSCDDLFKISNDIKLNKTKEHSKLQEITYMQNSAKSFYKMYDSSFSSIGYGFSYEKELDAKRFIFGLSIPLDALSSQNEKKRAEYFYENTSLKAQKDSLKSEIENKIKFQQLQIDALYDEYILLNEEILPMSLELKHLSKSALDEGGGSIMEYLDSTRSYSENVLEMLEIKKRYYNELFELYKKADIELGEI